MSLVLKQVETNWQILILFLKKYFYPQTVKKHQKGLRKRDSLVLLPRFSSIWDKVTHSARKVPRTQRERSLALREKTSTQRERSLALREKLAPSAKAPTPLERFPNKSRPQFPAARLKNHLTRVLRARLNRIPDLCVSLLDLVRSVVNFQSCEDLFCRIVVDIA